MMLLRGIAAAPGLALAECLTVQPLPAADTARQSVAADQIGSELALFRHAVEAATAELQAIADRAAEARETTRAGIISAQMLMLTDPLLEEEVRQKITSRCYSAVRAVHETTKEQAAILAGLDDPYLRERSADVRDVGQRILGILMGVRQQDLSVLSVDTILVGREITPSQMAALDAAKVKGIVAETGGKTCHTAILANNMEIAAVLGCEGILAAVRDGMPILIDGTQGTVETEITPERQGQLRQEICRRRKAQASLAGLVDKPACTRDGVRVELSANIMDAAGAARAMSLGADGIGLYRTEFLFMDRAAAPEEQEQYEAYAKVLQAMNGKPVIIRTLDIGGDKEIAYLKLPKEENPFLGFRAIRICLADRALFMTQLRAILRAAVHGRATSSAAGRACSPVEFLIRTSR